MVEHCLFTEMTYDDMQNTEGGGFGATLAAFALKCGTAVGAACGVGTVGGFVIIGGCALAIVAGIYAGCKS